MQSKNRSLLGFLTFAVGLVVGGIAAVLFSTDESGNTRKGVQKNIAKTKGVLIDAADKERVKEIFGRLSTKASELYGEAKSNLTARVEVLKDQFEKIDKEKYAEVVSDVVAELKKEGTVTAGQLKKLKNYFVDDYQTFTRNNGKKGRTKKA